jgi:hypothetical protein
MFNPVPSLRVAVAFALFRSAHAEGASAALLQPVVVDALCAAVADRAFSSESVALEREAEDRLQAVRVTHRARVRLLSVARLTLLSCSRVRAGAAGRRRLAGAHAGAGVRDAPAARTGLCDRGLLQR